MCCELFGMFPDTLEPQAGGVWVPTTVTVKTVKMIESNLEISPQRKNNKERRKDYYLKDITLESKRSFSSQRQQTKKKSNLA